MGTNWEGYYQFLDRSREAITVSCPFEPGQPLYKKFAWDDNRNNSQGGLYVSGEDYSIMQNYFPSIIQSLSKEVSRKYYGQRTENTAENLSKLATSHAEECQALLDVLKGGLFPKDKIPEIVKKMCLLRKVAKVFKQQVDCMVLGTQKEHKQLALHNAEEELSSTFQTTYENLSQVILHLYVGVDLFDQNQERLLSIPYAAYLQLLPLEEVMKEPQEALIY